MTAPRHGGGAYGTSGKVQSEHDPELGHVRRGEGRRENQESKE